jgi:Predicted integral membrane protein
VLSAGVSEGLPYYTMPFIEGQSLRAKIANGGPLPVHEAVRILRDTLSALSYAHEHGVVHRDIKPDNILLTDQHAVVADFGVAKALSAATNPGSSLTSLGVALGTPAYMAPEQAAADPTTDHRADIYAVGAVGYEMLTGQQVFSTRSPQAMLAAHAMETPEPLQKRRASVPAPLASLIMRALEKYAADRPQTAREMLAELDAAVTPSGATTPHTGMMPARKVAPSRRSTWMAVGGAALLLLLGSSSYYWRSHRTAAASPAAAIADSSGAIQSVAVIPFVNTGGNANDEYFSDGMTDELAHALSRLPRLRVAGRTSSYAFKGKTVPVQQIGKELNVAAVVEGSIRRAGDRLRVIAQLTSTSDGRVMWSDSYESKAKDVFQLQDDFTKAIVGALTPTLAGTTAASVASTSRGTEDQVAYDYYLKGRYFFLRRGAALKSAVEYFAKAAEKDPKFARAFAGLSMAYNVYSMYIPVYPDTTAISTLAYAKKAVALDPNLGDAHLALASALGKTEHPGDASAEFQRALQLQPDDPTTHQWYGDRLEVMGNLDGGLAEEQQAAALDPLSSVIANELAYTHYLKGRFDDCVTADRHALELDPAFTIAEEQEALCHTFAGRPLDAVAVLERSYARDPSVPGLKGGLAFAYAAAGRWADASRVRAELLRPETHAAQFDLLQMHLAFGDRTLVLATLRDYAQASFDGLPLGCDPEFQPLLSDQRALDMFRQREVKTCTPIAPWPVKPPPPNFAVKQ